MPFLEPNQAAVRRRQPLPRLVSAVALLLALGLASSVAGKGSEATYELRSATGDWLVEVSPAEPETVSGQGAASQFLAEDAGAIFMVGLILGMVAGITLFFAHLRRREARLARFEDDGLMLDNWPSQPSGAPNSTSLSSTDPSASDEMIEQREPWERSVDWWKNPDQS
jgi:hypothetical protein